MKQFHPWISTDVLTLRAYVLQTPTNCLSILLFVILQKRI